MQIALPPVAVTAAASATSAPAPAVRVAQRFAEHFKAFGVDEVVPTGVDQLTLKFDQQSGFDYMTATAAIKGTVDGVKLLFDLAEGANVPRLLPGVQHALPIYAKLPGVVGVDVAETFPEQVAINVMGRRNASDAVTLLNDRLPGGATIGVQVKDIRPNE